MRTLVCLALGLTLQESAPYLGAPVHYESAARTGPVAELAAALASGERTARWDEERGWLPALLDALDIPVESQLLVFSRTSLQRERISPERPRAIYFGDDVAVAWIPGSPFMEVTSHDPLQGPTFYALAQDPAGLDFERQDDSCLVCHASSRTGGWPGHIVRSVHPDARGFPILREGTYRTTARSPLAERWGGWYVTGTHGEARHMGNVTVGEGESRVDTARGANVTDLADRFDVSRYLSPHSDIVALMVYEHQADVQNALARASYEARRALDYQLVLNDALGEPADHVSGSTQRRIRGAAEDVVDALLLRDEASLEGPVRGTSGFSAVFAARGPRDEHGRSLFELDLERRLLRYGCSPFVYSAALAELPDAVRRAVWDDLRAILEEREGARPMPHLSDAERRAILEILGATHPGLPVDW